MSSNIIEFKNKEILHEYLQTTKGFNLKKNIGFGAEGTCYANTKSNEAVKIFDGNDDFSFDPKKIITTRDIKCDFFAFPITLFSVDNKLEAYITKLIKKDLLKRFEENAYRINYDKLIKAYYNLKKDVENLSAEQIKIYDLAYNLLFDGENLIGIDTCHYTRQKGDLLSKNLICLDKAMKSISQFFIEEKNIEIDDNLEVEEYFKTFKKELKSTYKKEVQNEKTRFTYTY